MSIVADLMNLPGVIAAGEYAFRGDRYSYRGQLTEDQARMCTILCRASTMGIVMQGRMAETALPGAGIRPRGGAMRGPEHAMCVVGNVFCVMKNQSGTMDSVLARLNTAMADVDMHLV